MLFKKKIKIIKEEPQVNDKYVVITDGIGKLQQGDKSTIHIVYNGLGYGDRSLNQLIGSTIREHLETYSMKDMIRLSEQFKQYTSLEWYFDWKGIVLKNSKSDFKDEKDYIYVLILGSFHPNGYFREGCILELANYEETLPYIILRLNDWVEEIRKSAAELVKGKIKHSSVNEILNSTMALNKVVISERRNSKEIENISKEITDRVIQDVKILSVEEISQFDFEMRKNCYRIIFSDKILDHKQAGYLLKMEKHTYCLSIILAGIFRFYEPRIEELDIYLNNKSALVRRMTLEYKYSLMGGSWDGLEANLLDNNAGVRKYVVWVLQKYTDLDILNYYIQALQGDKCHVAIIGIGENGGKDQIDLLIPYLENSNIKIVKSSILALGKLMEYEGYELFWKYLLDPRLEISKAAFLSICRNSIKYNEKKLFDEYKSNKNNHTKRYLALLLVRGNTWERLPYLLHIYNDIEVVQLQGLLLCKIMRRELYNKISVEQAEFIRNEVEHKKDILPKEVLDKILFDLKYIAIE